MKRFKNLLAYIPHNDSDKTIMNWCGTIARNAHSNKVDMLICYEDFYPDLQDSELSWSELVAKETQRLEALASQFLEGVEYKISVVNKAPATAMLGQLSSGEYDLLIMPKQTVYGISLVEKLARKSPSGILVVPEDAPPNFKSIMVGVDFADLSPLSIEWAEAFSEITNKNTTLDAMHVMRMPDQSRAMQVADPESIRLHLYRVSHEKLESLVRRNSQQPDAWELHISENPLAANQIVKEAVKKGSDLLVMGSHGRNALSVALLGGQTSELIRQTPIPLLIAKKKNESLGFLKHLLGLDK